MQNLEFQKQLDTLFEQWEQKTIDNGLENFCRDGLMYKGEKYSDSNNEYWFRHRGSEDELWGNAPKRILVLAKDPHEDGRYDLRERMCRENNAEVITNRFYKNIALWLYGLLNIDNNGKSPLYNTVTKKEYTDFFDQTSFAYANIKKVAGESSITNRVLRQYFDCDKDFILKEILILDADIIICCGGSGIIKDFIVENVYKDLKFINNWMYYSESENKLIIDSYHPSARNQSDEDMYTDMMEGYKDFLDKYPKFKDSCRK
jgi:hypothetical protein